jgi:hypothetical protein
MDMLPLAIGIVVGAVVLTPLTFVLWNDIVWPRKRMDQLDELEANRTKHVTCGGGYGGGGGDGS